jgi:hypothetical protein
MIYIPVSLGELVDKITILKIKLSKIQDPLKLKNVQKEYSELTKILNANSLNEEHSLFKELYDINLIFWDYHDWQREQWKESNDNFINIELYKKTREEHILNDKRAEIKKKINTQFNSEIVEEKQFISYNI